MMRSLAKSEQSERNERIVRTHQVIDLPTIVHNERVNACTRARSAVRATRGSVRTRASRVHVNVCVRCVRCVRSPYSCGFARIRMRSQMRSLRSLARAIPFFFCLERKKEWSE